jgi:probable F420-dependent oxidoreductase
VQPSNESGNPPSPHPRRFRFGVLAGSEDRASDWRSLARRAEDLGYSTLLLPDHFHGQMAPLPALAVAAEATTELRVGTLVLANDYRHPVVLAKELATLDELTGGRLEAGLGAGWSDADYDQSGIAMDRAGGRISRMEEGIAVLKGCFGAQPFSFAGSHYKISDYDGLPKPKQSPLPLLIGGGGRRVLGVAAREADIVGINTSITASGVDSKGAVASDTDEKLRWVREAAGERFNQVEINMLQHVAAVTENRSTAIDSFAPRVGLSPDQLDTYPHACIGSARQIADDLRARRERWDVSYIVFMTGVMEAMAPVVAELRGT